MYTCFDGRNRPIYLNSSDSSTNAYATWSYDDTTGGNNGASPCGTISAGTLATAYYQQS